MAFKVNPIMGKLDYYSTPTTGVSFSEAINLSNSLGTEYEQKVIDSALTFTYTSAVAFGSAFVSLVSDGTNPPDFSAFTQHPNSDSWNNTANAINEVTFFKQGSIYYYHIVDTGRTYSASDTTAPTIQSFNLEASNTYVDVTMSEGVYGANDGSTPLAASDLQISNFSGSGATALSIASITNNSDGALTGGETVIRIVLSITGTPDGNETFEIQPVDASSIYDAAANAMLGTQTTGTVTLNDETSDITAPTIQSFNLEASNTYVDVTMSEGVYGANDGSTPLAASDLQISNFSGSGATALSIASITNNSDGALSGGETVIRIVLSITGTPDGNETFEIQPVDASSIYDAAANAMLGTQTTGTVTLNDETSDITAPTIQSFNLEASNTYVDVTMSEGVYGANDGSTPLAASDLQISNFSGSGATALSIASITNNSDGALTGGETVIRIVLSITGTPDGNETFEIQPVDASSIYDAAANAMLGTQTTGTVTLNDATASLENILFDPDWVDEDLTVTNNSVTKDSGNSSTLYNAAIGYQKLVGDGFFRFKITYGSDVYSYFHAGLKTDKAILTNVEDLDYYIRPDASSPYTIRYWNGASETSTSGEHGANTWYEFNRVGSTLYVKRSLDGTNFITIHTATVTTSDLYFYACLGTIGQEYTDCQISHYSDATAPVIQSLNVYDQFADKIYITFDDLIDSNYTPTLSDFTPSGGKSVTAISFNNRIIELTVDSDYANGDSITLSYSQGVTPLRDVNGNYLTSFTDEVVTNNVLLNVNDIQQIDTSEFSISGNSIELVGTSSWNNAYIGNAISGDGEYIMKATMNYISAIGLYNDTTTKFTSTPTDNFILLIGASVTRAGSGAGGSYTPSDTYFYLKITVESGQMKAYVSDDGITYTLQWTWTNLPSGDLYLRFVAGNNSGSKLENISYSA